jgi:hypothetical protein
LPITTSCASSYFGDITSGYGYTLSDIVFEPSPTCYANPSPTTTLPPVQDTSVTLCQPDLVCPSGACLSTSQAANLCVFKYGLNTCPVGYPNATTLSEYIADTRTCGSCSCGSTLTCALDSVLIDNLTTCSTTGHPYWMNATTSCTTAPGNYPIGGVKANGTSTGNPTCAETSPSNPMGTVELDQNYIATVCCK